MQNSRRKGPEFVNAFWTVLPAVLRDVLDTGDDAANRLIQEILMFEDPTTRMS